MKTISVQSRSFQASQATICGDREHAPAAKYSFMSGSLLQHAPNAQRQWRPDRGYNPALVKPWSNRGRSQGTNNLWNAMCDIVWSNLTIIPGSLL